MKPKRPSSQAGREICLGLVILPQPGRMHEAIEQLKADDRIELGEVLGHCLPACAITTIGCDEALLAQLEALPAVLRAEIAYVEVLEDQQAP